MSFFHTWFPVWILADEKIAAWIAASEKGCFSHRIPTKFHLYLLNVFEKIPKNLHLYLFFQKLSLPLRSTSQKNEVGEIKFDIGEMAEWSIAAVLKTVDLNGSGGSNPSLSAINAENQQIIKQTPNFTPKNVKLGVFILFKTNHIRSENNLIKNRTNEKNNQFIFRKISYLCSK